MTRENSLVRQRKKITGVVMVGTSVCPAIPPLVLRAGVMKYLF